MSLLSDILSTVDARKRVLLSNLADAYQNPQAFASGLLSSMGQDVRDYGTRMQGLLGEAGSVIPEVRAAGQEGLLGQAMNFAPLGIFAGAGAKTANKAALAQAQRMAKAGADPVDVWKATGWTDQFPDRKWRFEISDKTAKVKPNPADYLDDRLITESVTHPDYFSAYPQLRDMTASFDRQYKGQKGVGSAGFLEDYPHISVTANAKETKPITLHEMQHVVQGEEGFARGGSPEEAASLVYKTRKANADALKKQADDILQSIGVPGKSQQERIRNFNTSAWPWEKETYSAEQLKQARDLLYKANIESAAAVRGTDAYEAYRSLAGEAEARLTQSRMNLTPAERAARPPWLEFDVPREQQIVRGLLGP